MKLTDAQIQMMQEDMYADLVQLLMEHWQYPMDKALDTLYNSDTSFARQRNWSVLSKPRLRVFLLGE